MMHILGPRGYRPLLSPTVSDRQIITRATGLSYRLSVAGRGIREGRPAAEDVDYKVMKLTNI